MRLGLSLNNRNVLIVLAILLASVPFVSAQLEITDDLPSQTSDRTITISGSTDRGATVHVFVNDLRKRAVTTTSGNFVFRNIVLNEGTNTIRVESRYEGEVDTKEFAIFYDGTPPAVTLDEEIPQSVKANSLTITGTVEEPVTIRHRVTPRTDRMPPALIGSFEVSNLEADAVELTWDPSDATDFQTYVIARDDKRIASTSVTSFRDEGLPSDEEYTYTVAAVDSSCNIGTSAIATATTLSGGDNVTEPPVQEVILSCEPEFTSVQGDGAFSLTIQLTEGFNDLEIYFEDSAGNAHEIVQTIAVDNTAPTFEETNLDSISPAYIPEVKIRGRLNEQATVFVYLNDEKNPSAFEVTEADGSFSLDIQLRTERRITTSTRQTTVEVGEGWTNSVRLEAVDLAGNVASLGPNQIDFLLCGQGTWWQPNIGEPLPTNMLPRLMLQGVQQIGIPFNITYIGNYPADAPPRVDVRPIALSRSAEEDYDHDWVTVTDYPGRRSPNNYIGYVQVQFDNVNPLPDKPDAGVNEKELALSDYRKGDCIVPGFGCVKLFLQIEVLFQEKITYRPAEQFRPTDPRRQLPAVKIENRVQRICLPIEVGIDQSIPTDIIPEGLLKNALTVIDKAINLIDKVLKPITTIGEYVLYGCLASNVWLVVNFFQERMACEGSQILTIFDGPFDKRVAETGLCDEFYGEQSGSTDTSQSQKHQTCKRCESTIASRKKFEVNVMRSLCDRVGCPSAPTLATYIRDNMGTAEVLLDDPKLSESTAKPELAKWAIDNKIYWGNDCAFSFKTVGDYISPTYGGAEKQSQEYQGEEEFVTYAQTQGLSQAEISKRLEAGIKPGEFVTYAGKLGIREIRDIAKDAAQPKTFPKGPTAEDCKNWLHPAHPNCCGVQYQKDWSSACGPGANVGMLDTFDELERSTCLSAEYANADASDLKCNRLWNSVAGFCEDNTGEPSPEVVNTEASWIEWKEGADDNLAYVFLIPASYETRNVFGIVPRAAQGRQYRVWRGYAVKTPQFARIPGETKKKSGVKDQFRLTAGFTAAVDKDLTRCFGQRATVGQTAQRATDAEQRACLEKELCDGKITPCQKGPQLDRIYNRINSIIGVGNQEYIVRPYSGLLRSAQCACLPAVTSYLQMWRSVLGAFHGCFSKILLTGEGSEGFCAAALSGTICDLFFEALSCFTQKFSTPGVGARASIGGFGDVLGAITGAGTDVTRSVSSRYGETSLYKSLFSERKLVNAVCNWAFTGTWDLDVSGLFQQQVADIPVDSEAALTTCQRTFISYDPTSSPPGMTTWAYRIAGGLIAGADLRYRLNLKCSSGFKCDPRNYPDGKCDCVAREEVLPVSTPEFGRGVVRKFDLVNFDSPFVVSPQNSYDLAGYRYDTAELEWEWTDPVTKQVRVDKVDCAIRETAGGGAPAFCSLDAFSGKFRCAFGEQDSGVRMGIPKAAYPEGQDAFALTQGINFSVDITQVFPTASRKQRDATKFFVYDIRDAAGKTIRGKDNRELKTDLNTVPQQYHLTTDGTYQFRVPRLNDATPLGTFTLDEKVIKDHAVRGAPGKPPQQYIGISTSKRFVNYLTMADTTGKRLEGTRYFVIYFPNVKTDPLGYEVRMVAPGTTSLTRKPGTGWLDYAQKVVVPSKKQLAGNLINRITFDVQADTQTQTLTSRFLTYETTLEFESVTGFNVDSIQILVTYAPARKGAVDPCTTKDPIIWTAYFTVHDSNRGAPSEQISTDPETGQQQAKTVTFNVMCATPEEVRAKFVGVKLPDKKQIEIILNSIIKNAEDVTTILTAKVNLAEAKIRQDVVRAIEYIIAELKSARNQHAPLVPNLAAPNEKNKALKDLWNPSITKIESFYTTFKTAPNDIAAQRQQDIVTELGKIKPALQEALDEVAPAAVATQPTGVVLVNPPSGWVIEPGTSAYLSWQAPPEVQSYAIEIKKDGTTFANQAEFPNTELTMQNIEIGEYTWNVLAFMPDGSVKMSEVGSFSVREEAPPIPAGTGPVIWGAPAQIAPQLGASLAPGDVTFSWEPLGKPYKFELYRSGTSVRSFETQFTTVIDTLEPGNYEWRVGAFTPAEPEVKWSPKYSFTVLLIPTPKILDDQLPGQVVITTSANGFQARYQKQQNQKWRITGTKGPGMTTFTIIPAATASERTSLALITYHSQPATEAQSWEFV